MFHQGYPIMVVPTSLFSQTELKTSLEYCMLVSSIHSFLLHLVMLMRYRVMKKNKVSMKWYSLPCNILSKPSVLNCLFNNEVNSFLKSLQATWFLGSFIQKTQVEHCMPTLWPFNVYKVACWRMLQDDDQSIGANMTASLQSRYSGLANSQLNIVRRLNGKQKIHFAIVINFKEASCFLEKGQKTPERRKEYLQLHPSHFRLAEAQSVFCLGPTHLSGVVKIVFFFAASAIYLLLGWSILKSSWELAYLKCKFALL